SLSGFLLAYLPCLCAVVGLRSLPDAPASSLVHLRSAALLLTLIAGVATALPAMLRGLLFEIPWLFGRLGRTDDLLAAALSEPDSALGLHRSMGRLDPLARIFVRRRLALWRSAAQGVPGVKEADLARVIRILEQRWREEAREANPQAEPATGTGRWPWWMRPGVPSVGLSLLLAAAAFGAAVRWRADPNEQPSGLCRIGQLLDPRVEQLFAEEIPSLIMDMSSNPVPVESLPAYAQVQGALAGLEPALPGIGAAVTDLIRMGRRGRRRSYSIRRARDRLNHLLRDAQQPFFVCARLRPRPGLPENWGDLFYVLSYRIRACRTYRCSDRRFAVLELARIDELNVVENYLGMTEQRETSVAVFADRLAAFMEGRLHGVLQRGDLVGRIARRALGELAPGAAIEEGPQGAVGCALREGLTRHELHHRWAGLDPDPPNWLWAALAGFADESVHGVTAEIGAYLGEMRTSPAYARLRLALMLDALESPAGRSGIHGRARAFAVGGLLLSSSNQLFPSAQSELDRAAVVLDAIDDSTLIARIDALHEKVFGQPTPVFEPVEPEERKDGL
ncbi:MAG: hypothetical protein JXR96_07755, partial [Deltaproteobacteria bacterium]|nr:hypothetical protein [Deltaproteobacteria bacterium]